MGKKKHTARKVMLPFMRVDALLSELNRIRVMYKGDTYSMADIRRFSEETHGRDACSRIQFLDEWISTYKEWAPAFKKAGVGLQEADNAFIKDNGAGIGPSRYAAWAQKFMNEHINADLPSNPAASHECVQNPPDCDQPVASDGVECVPGVKVDLKMIKFIRLPPASYTLMYQWQRVGVVTRLSKAHHKGLWAGEVGTRGFQGNTRLAVAMMMILNHH